MTDSFRQQLKGGYNVAAKSGPAFYNLRIQNSMGVELAESNAKSRNAITLSDGLVYLNDYILAVGDNNPGSIKGFNSYRYFVTGNQPGHGLLLRENIRNTDGQVIFPVGSRASAYTPAAVRNNSGFGDDYYVNVFDSVKSSVFSGNSLADKSVNKTWRSGKDSALALTRQKCRCNTSMQMKGPFLRQTGKMRMSRGLPIPPGTWDPRSPILPGAI